MTNDEAKKILTSWDRVDLLHKLVTSVVQEWKDAGLFRSCLNCSHWSPANPIANANEPAHPEGCSKYRQTPPAKIIVTGCDQHSDMIPF